MPLGNRGVELEPHPLEVRGSAREIFSAEAQVAGFPSVVACCYRYLPWKRVNQKPVETVRAMDGTFIGNKSIVAQDGQGAYC